MLNIKANERSFLGVVLDLQWPLHIEYEGNANIEIERVFPAIIVGLFKRTFPAAQRLGDICKLAEQDLLASKGWGEYRVLVVRKVLEKYGLKCTHQYWIDEKMWEYKTRQDYRDRNKEAASF